MSSENDKEIIPFCKTVCGSKKHAFNINSDTTTVNLFYNNRQERRNYLCFKIRLNKGKDHNWLQFQILVWKIADWPFAIDY